MADGNVAARAHDALGVVVSAIAVDGCSNAFVTVAACSFDDLVIEFRDLNRVWVVAAGEIEGMPETVIRFDRVLPDDVVRGVTVVASRCVVMAGLDPTVVLLAHDVTIHAGLRIVG
jgi:hypothetical protein